MPNCSNDSCEPQFIRLPSLAGSCNVRRRPTNLDRLEMIAALEEIVTLAESRRLMAGVKPLPLKGNTDEAVKIDVVAALYSGRLVAMSSTFAEELIGFLQTH
jgi:hypothetical protein